MNDIDRSVESFDFALRRRFAWVEVHADETLFDAVVGNLDEDTKKIARKRYLALNAAIKEAQGLGESYKIGPAYFLKLEHYTGADRFQKLWSNHLWPLISEYLRGRTDFKKITAALENAYNPVGEK